MTAVLVLIPLAGLLLAGFGAGVVYATARQQSEERQRRYPVVGDWVEALHRAQARYADHAVALWAVEWLAQEAANIKTERLRGIRQADPTGGTS